MQGDGHVTLEEFEAWWKGQEAESLIQEMTTDDIKEALSDMGIQASGGASVLSMKQALKAHYTGKDMTTRQVFDTMDADNSGRLDREEVEKASGVLSASLGFVMSAEEVDKQFKLMDPDGDGEVTFAEFELWWKGVEAETLVGDMDRHDIVEALSEMGIDVAAKGKGTSQPSLTTMREVRTVTIAQACTGITQ